MVLLRISEKLRTFALGHGAKDARSRAGSLPASPFSNNRVRVEICTITYHGHRT